MRDALVTAIVVGVLPFVFARPWVGVLLWTWLSLMNPHRLAWGFAYNAPFAAIAAVVTLISLVTSRTRVRLPATGAVYGLIAFIVWMCVTTTLAIYPGESFVQLDKVIKIQLMTLVALAVLHEPRHINWFVWLNVLSLGFFGVKGGLYTIQTGGAGRVWGPGGFIGGNNEIGLAILVTIPLMYYLYLQTQRRLVRAAVIAMMLLSGIAVLGTQSRGAFLAIVVMSGMLWWRAPRKLLSGIALLIAAAIAFAVMPSSYGDRLDTITEYKKDSSAMGRINAWQTTTNIANSRPFGGGFAIYNAEVFSRYAPNVQEERAADPSIVRAAHSIYFQVLGEHGWLGLLLFLSVWFMTWRDAERIRQATRGDPELNWVSHLMGMCQVALAGYAVGGAFLSLAYFDLPYNVLVLVSVTRRWIESRLAERSAGLPSGKSASSPVTLTPLSRP